MTEHINETEEEFTKSDSQEEGEINDNSINHNHILEEYESLQKKYKELDENYQKMLRTAAHVQNLYNEIKNNQIKDLDRERKKVKLDIFHSIIKFIDMLELTLDSINQQKSGDNKSLDSIISGINMVYKYILSDLENKFQLKKVPCKVGDSFDSEIHEAQQKVATKDQSQDKTIARIVSGGYYLGTEVLNNPIVDVYGYQE